MMLARAENRMYERTYIRDTAQCWQEQTLVFLKVGEYPQGPGNTEVWHNWPIKLIFRAWRPCMQVNSSATEPLKLKDLLAGAKVSCNYNSGHEVGRMMSKILEKANECSNPTTADQAEAIKLLLKKHKRVAGMYIMRPKRSCLRATRECQYQKHWRIQTEDEWHY